MTEIEEKYILLAKQACELAEVDRLWLPMLANMSTLIYDTIGNVNWVGFYLIEDNRLVLGPYKGQVACVSIKRGAGVCGTAWATGKTQHVPDVHQFPGHIACDSASKSEVVIPLRRADSLIVGVLDIDSPVLSRFTESDVKGLEYVAAKLSEFINWRSVSLGDKV